MAAYYAYSQINQIISRLAGKAFGNSLSEKLRPQMVQKQSRISFALLENPETLDLISRVSDNTEGQVMAIFNSGIRLVRLGVQVFGVILLLATHIWWIIPWFVISTIPIILTSRRAGRKILEMYRSVSKLTRRQYYLSNILVGRETAAERTLFGYADDINRILAQGQRLSDGAVP